MNVLEDKTVHDIVAEVDTGPNCNAIIDRDILIEPPASFNPDQSSRQRESASSLSQPAQEGDQYQSHEDSSEFAHHDALMSNAPNSTLGNTTLPHSMANSEGDPLSSSEGGTTDKEEAPCRSTRTCKPVNRLTASRLGSLTVATLLLKKHLLTCLPISIVITQ